MGQARIIVLSVAAISLALVSTVLLLGHRTTPDVPHPGDRPVSSASHSTAESHPAREADQRAAAALPSKSPNAKRSRADWYNATQNATDYVATVRDAAAAAEQGDDGAAREMGTIMLRCALPLRSIRAGESRESYVANFPGSSNPVYAAHVQRIYDQCAPLATAPDFASWPTGPQGKWGVRCWRELALKLGNPAAEAETLVEDVIGTSTGTPEQREQAQVQARKYVKDILLKADGEAWYRLGMRLGNSDFSSDVSTGFALALASCHIGYDCSGDNERNDWYACRWQEGCTEKMDLNERVKMMMSPDLYAKAYSKSQQLTEMIDRGAWDEVQNFVELDGSLFRK